jgi:hypothetical protein
MEGCAMLSPEDVKPLLVHEDRYIREAAFNYFRESWSNDSDIIPLLLCSYEVYGAGDMPRPLAWGYRFSLDESSIDAVMRTLAACGQKDTVRDLNSILKSAAPSLLASRLSSLKDARNVVPEALAAIERRVELAEWPADRLWQELQDYAVRSESKKYVNDIDHRYADALIAALAMHETPSGDAICQMLRAWDEGGDDLSRSWLEIFLVDLAGKRRLREAIPALVDKYRVDTDYLLERATIALARIGDVEAVREVRRRYVGESKHFRWYAHSVFGDIKHPESEEAIFEALASEEEITIRTMLCGELCKLFSARGVEVVAEEIRGGYDDFYDKLDARVLPIAEVLGIELPEAEEWRAERAERAQRRIGRQTELADLARLVAKHERNTAKNRQVGPGGGFGDDDLEGDDLEGDDFDGSRDEDSGDTAQVSVSTVRNAKIKVGRNDLCPCGSGKKFKKCCR